MLDAVRGAHQRLLAATQAFNAQWPAAVAGGEVWTLPVLSRQKALDVICPQRARCRARGSAYPVIFWSTPPRCRPA